MRFDRIFQVVPSGLIHAACLDHVARAFASATGLPLEKGEGDVPGRSIVIGAHLVSKRRAIGDGCAIWNTEQVFDGSVWMSELYLARCRQAELWDYAQANIDRWGSFGVGEVRRARLLFDPSMVNPRLAERAPQRPLFYGSTCPRRDSVVRASGARWAPVSYGEKLDAELMRASVVLNVHYYAAAVLETVRLSYLWANGVPVLSEHYRGDDFWLDLMPRFTFAPYSELANRVACRAYPPGDLQRDAYRATSLTDELKPLL